MDRNNRLNAESSQTSPLREGRRALGEERSPVPLYHRIYVLLRERILSGEYRVGETLPTEAELMNRYAVSRITARRALDELAYEGLVTRSRGRGTTISSRPVMTIGDAPIVAGIEGLMANLSIIGRQTTVTVYEFEFVPAPEPIAAELQITPGAVVHRAVRTRSLDGKPFSLSTTYVLEEIGRTYSREEMTSIPLIDLITRSGTKIGHVDQRLTATLADDLSAQRLGLHVASPLLKVLRLFYDVEDRCCYYVNLLYAPSRFEYRMTLKRGHDDRFRVEGS
jgi:GntR family transcriptional regulator